VLSVLGEECLVVCGAGIRRGRHTVCASKLRERGDGRGARYKSNGQRKEQ
jgi:hypothetical protein